MKTLLILGAAIISLAACGPLNEGSALARNADVFLARTGIGDSTALPPPPELTRAQIEAQPVDLLRISIISREATSVFTKVAQNGPRVTWQSGEGVGVILQGGLIVGTRGVGDDVMGSDVSGALASLRRGGNHLRTLDFLNGLGQIERRTYQCETVRTRDDDVTIFDVTYDTTIVEETCTNPSGEFKNTYWVDRNLVVWQARQWVSNGVGYLGYQRL